MATTGTTLRAVRFLWVKSVSGYRSINKFVEIFVTEIACFCHLDCASNFTSLALWSKNNIGKALVISDKGI